MANKDTNDSPSNLWARRSNSSKVSLSTTRSDRADSHASPSIKRGFSSSGKSPFGSLSGISTSGVSSPTGTGASSAFGLGSGAFASFGGGKTPKTPGGTLDPIKAASARQDSGDEAKEASRRPAPTSKKSLGTLSAAEPQNAAGADLSESGAEHPIKYAWVVYYRPPTSKNSDYEKSIRPMFRMDTIESFWKVYTHLKRPSQLPPVSDYHLFREGIRPVWEDDENKQGGKFTMRLKKGVADRLWERLVMTMVGDQFNEASDEVCGAVVSVRQTEDVISIWTKNNGGRNVKIRETIKRELELPMDTNILFRSHDDSIQSRVEVDKARAEKTGGRRNTNDRLEF
ncbi:Eukaryotic translation initiation factor 4E type 2 [Cercospora beticola]|uniref:Eukaryotic translation initiation factor 4E type 2 n=1 Tax=Cercospora beticola TaxID=122368 RepID=A0A2G5HH65_CERBT|nr:Eukaryotic translation initiation factor 4E type 2 [Cercospora beticola]PIA91936.1 Eukaryotic translation initiation factor 4E type 2 [Cercospora beticola]WPB06282.1 hypothetical protein RHO25_010939 [Cercospora beticola]CAK1366170.1 unnamed protein product [Cercospora beticola]